MLELQRPGTAEVVNTVRVVGEIDVVTAPVLRHQIADAMLSRTDRVVLDLAGMTFIDASGLGVLVWFANAMAAEARPFSLTNVSAQARRVVTAAGLAGRLLLAA